MPFTLLAVMQAPTPLPQMTMPLSDSARQGVEHDNMNVVCIGGQIIGIELAKVVLEAFLGANFIPEPRFQRRLDKLMKVEETGLP